MAVQHGFIDESRRGSQYLLTLTLVPSSAIRSTTRAVLDMVEQGRQRTHFVDERPSARRKIIDAYQSLDTLSQVAIATYGGGDDQEAREVCLRALMERFDEWQLRVLVMDTRGESRDLLDRRAIVRAERERIVTGPLQYSHQGSRNEPLLSLPDAIGWCYGAGGDWRRRVEPIIGVVLRP